MKKKYLKVLLWLVGIVLLLIMVAAFVVYVNREKVKQVILTELNKQLATPINVSSIKVDFFSTFPSVSLAFDDVIAFDAFPKDSLTKNNSTISKDTLFYFRKLYLSFDFWDVVSENYEINKITAKDGQLNVRVRQNGDVNFIFWKQGQAQTNSNFSLSLRKVILEEVNLSYRNDYNKQYYEIFLKDAIAKGNLSGKEQKITINSKSTIKNIQLDRLVISNEKDFNFNIIISNNTVDKLIQISKGELIVEGLAFDVRGHLDYKTDNIIDIIVNSNKVRLEDMINLLPNQQKNLFKDYKGKGELVFDFSMKGKISSTQMPSIKSKFYITNGELINKKLDIAFTNIILKGEFSNGAKRNSQTSFIKLDKFYFHWNKGVVKGYGQLFNLSNLSLDAKIDCFLPLDIVHRFIQSKDIKHLSGDLHLDFKINGDIKSLENIPKAGFSKIKMEGGGSLKSLNYSDTRIAQPIKNLTSNLIFNNSSIEIKNLNTYLGNSSLSFDGEVQDILPYIFKHKEAFNVLGKLKIASLNLNDWTNNTAKAENNSKEKNHNSKDTIEKRIELPKIFNADLLTEIDKLNFNKTEINKFRSRIKLIGGNLILEDMSLSAFEGTLKGNTSIILNGKTPKIFGDIEASSIEASRFFSQLNEFGQSSITSNNIKGKVSLGMNFSAELNENLDLNKDKLKANIKYKIEQGELKDIPLLKKLSYFVEESNLNNVKFNTIESNISIDNSCITLDEIKINSNAISFSFLGKHYLNTNIDYRAKIHLSELSSKKKKQKIEKQRQEFGDFEEDENSRMILFIKITGTTDKPIFAYDFKQNMQKAKATLQKDTKNIASSIDKDLKLGVKQMQKDKEEFRIREKGEYIIEWEENFGKRDTISVKEDTIQTKFNIEWE